MTNPSSAGADLTSSASGHNNNNTVAAIKITSDNGQEPWTPSVKKEFEAKRKSAYMDPCQDAASRSIRCLRRNNGDRTFCHDYFEAYRNCKKQWTEARSKGKFKETPKSQ